MKILSFTSTLSILLGVAMILAGTVQTYASYSATTTKTEKTVVKDPSVLDQSAATPQDIEITRRIREELNKSENLSVAAKNIEVITLDNVVTLRGKVPTSEEQQEVTSVARGIAGTTKTIRNETVVDSMTK